MIKTFEEFINENYNKNVNYGEEYGYPLFNEVSESLMSEIYNSINEGVLTINTNMIEEGIFDSIGKMFTKGVEKMKNKSTDINDEIEHKKGVLKYIIDLPKNGGDIIEIGASIKREEINAEVYEKIEELCKYAEDICKKLAEKEENTYKTISEKMTATNEAIQEFTEKSVNKLKEIVEISKNKISDIISAVVILACEMAEMAKDGLKKLGIGAAIAFSLPFLVTYSIYKCAVSVCEMLIEKIKDGAEIVKESLIKIKNSIANWVEDMLEEAKELLNEACDKVKNGAKKAYEAIGKSYLTIVATLGQLVSDTKDKISKAYNDFIESAEEFTDEVKSYISEKWNVVSNWCKKTSTAFADGIKNVWEKTKEKVMGAIESAKEAYNDLKDDANATWNEVVEWNTERQQKNIKAKMKYAVDKWGKDEVSSWLDEI